jgi:hypothetical protein
MLKAGSAIVSLSGLILARTLHRQTPLGFASTGSASLLFVREAAFRAYGVTLMAGV